ncbi:MAG: MoaD/ThiS family protein [Microbacterium sp.]|uniref:MoaD/ThiS family protein n=1 Tax=Microbacterium sp. TaxID=51671 RepID=UPI001AD21125|nr:MoaD/ThiS family protein [Microbacterium sp.]MBN9177531.1 MoaD/ThiS family protein [Microbacterium sp.]
MSIVSVRYFAAASDAAGREQEELVLDANATLGTLRTELLRRYGDPMARVLRSGSFLVDGIARCDAAHPLGRQVDVLPPFAGG